MKPKYQCKVFTNLQAYQEWLDITKDEIISVVIFNNSIVVTVKKITMLNEVVAL